MSGIPYRRKGARSPAFTLIELLIVVAIIAILAAIAVPNFIEAQVRSKVSRVKADMRSLATTFESYAVDYNTYANYWIMPVTIPWESRPGGEPAFWAIFTTPVSYITSVPRDVFIPSESWDPLGRYEGGYFHYTDRRSYRVQTGDPTGGDAWWVDYLSSWDGSKANRQWSLKSFGPDMVEGWVHFVSGGGEGPTPHENYPYDTTNGTRSIGDIVRWGP